MTILITNPFHPDSISIFNDSFTVFNAHENPQLLPKIKVAKALLIRSKTKVNSDFLSQAPMLQFIATATSGLDHIDLELCRKKNIEVFNPKEVNSISAAEHSFALLLSVVKNLKLANSTLNKNNWQENLNRGLDLNGKTIGIIGLGRVGSKVSQMAAAFNMKVQAYDPYKSEDYFKSFSTKKNLTLDSLISSSDIISIHTPLSMETKYLLNTNNLSLAHKNTIVINTSRGGCIKESDLIQLLKLNKIRAAGLDVFDHEPIDPNNELLQLNNVFLSPHIGAYTEESFLNASLACTNWLVDKLQPLK